MAGIFKTFSPKLNPSHVMGVSGDSPAGKPDGAIGYVAEGGLGSQYSVDKFPLEPDLEARGVSNDEWAVICQSLADGKRTMGLGGGFSKAIARANELYFDKLGLVACYMEYGKGQKAMAVFERDSAIGSGRVVLNVTTPRGGEATPRTSKADLTVNTKDAQATPTGTQAAMLNKALLSASPVSGCVSEATMQAIVQHTWGGSEVLELMTVPRPKPSPGQLLIKVKAAGINPVDWKLREGYLKGGAPMMGGKLESGVVLGWEVAGEVMDCGIGANDFKVGDKVFARPENDDWGCYAEYCIAGKRAVAPMPSCLTFEEAAAVPLAALTAYQSMFEDGKLQAGQHVLIHAGSGGVGGFAIQLAVAKGAVVTTTCGAKNVDYCKELGATTVIDYREEDFTQVVKDMDMVFNMTGAESATKSIACLKEGGTLVSIAGAPDPEVAAAKSVTALNCFVVPDGRQLAEIGALIEEGKVKVTVDKIFPLAEAAQAQDYQKGGVARGKVVLSVPQPAQ